MLRIGMLTSGGDCQALNATMRGVVKGLSENVKKLEIYGFLNGYRGLIYSDFRLLDPSEFSGILTQGGTILGTSRVPFKTIREPDENGLDKVEAMKQNYYKLKLDCLVVLGGNGSQKTANLLREEGLHVIHMPKTIDNDICGTDMTFGFQSAVDIATQAIDCVHTTAASHNRVFVVEIMGHKVGSLTLHAGIAGGADVILIPEIPYDTEKVAKVIRKREKAGKNFTIIAAAEGSIDELATTMTKKEYKNAKKAHMSVAYYIANKLLEYIPEADIRVVNPGHTQRGGSPDAYDRVLCSRLGAAGAQAILDEDYGNMIGIVNGETTRVPLSEVAGKLKTVDPDCSLIKEARMLGISFGD